ncbi:MAG: DNA repair protein RadA [Caldisericia bacterium]|nr:DNA repair protein RadA [Caldisericia bacterium]
MSKENKKFVCKECGYESYIKLGKCPFCGSWDSFQEKDEKEKINLDSVSLKLYESDKNEIIRLKTGFSEIDELLGGGFLSGSFVLISGEPGIGKSTLLLQICLNVSKTEKVLYISGEESSLQILNRIKRLTQVIPENFYLIYEIDIDKIIDALEKIKPSLFILDSIQVIRDEEIDSLSGSPSQVRNVAEKIGEFIKRNMTVGVVVGHITKEGEIAGPKLLEHIVDTVLYLEGEKYQYYRLLRCKKNRFGSTQDIVVLSMEEEGLKEIKNPSSLFLTKREKEVPGSTIVPVIETGQKPILVELQTLSVPTYYTQPRRICLGIDLTRVSIMIALIEKFFKLNLSKFDIFVNVTGGIKIEERSSDLPLIISIYSSLMNLPTSNIVSFGEVGLSGEIRPVSFIKRRILESIKLGFKNFIVPNFSKNDIKLSKEVNLIEICNINELKDVLKKGV